ncbi:MAG: AraC family transcriptional regulator [Kangiellaceae bacterium]|jgi:AraC-like DNA-binding protein|nr:AraC family transcriptional regulator [Kangiellaceae bacterium]
MTTSAQLSKLYSDYLKELLAMTGTGDKLPKDLKVELNVMHKALEQGSVSESGVEQFIEKIIDRLELHDYVWQAAPYYSASRFIHKGPQFAYLLLSPNIKTALIDLKQFLFLFLPPSYSIEFSTNDSEVVVTISHPRLQSPITHIRHDTVVTYLIFICREVVNHSFDVTEITFSNDRSLPDVNLIRKFTQAKLSQNGNATQVKFDIKYFEPVNYYYQNHIREQYFSAVEKLINSYKIESKLTDQVANIIKSDDKPASLTIERVAARVGKSISTFRRGLAAEYTSFKELQNKIIDGISIEEILLSDTKVDVIALNLGYSDRSTFERSFRKKYGTTPTALRTLKERSTQNSSADIRSIVDKLPPLPESTQRLLKADLDDSLDLAMAVELIKKDPVFTARIMGLANKSIYGTAPKDLSQAIGRNLGLSTVVNLSVMFATKDALRNQVYKLGIDALMKVHILSIKIFQMVSKGVIDHDYTNQTINQIMMFGMLGLLVLCHKQQPKHELVIKHLTHSKSFAELNHKLNADMGLSIIAATVLLLSIWGINSEVIKFLVNLDNKLLTIKPLNQGEELILLSLSISLSLGYGLDHKEAIEQSCEPLKNLEFESSWQQSNELSTAY